MRNVFYACVRTRFGPLTQGQVNGFERLLDAFIAERTPNQHAAYLLATAWHETARTMLPVRETLADSDAQAIARLDNAYRRGKLRQVGKPYWRPDAHGRSYFGRGDVQLTHPENYRKAGELVGRDLVAQPELALDPEISALILIRGCTRGFFTGKRLADYLPGDWRGARRVINGLDRADQIADLAKAFYSCLLRAFPEGVGAVMVEKKTAGAAP